MQIAPCPGCSLYCLVDNEGPLALKSVGGKLLHKSCLSILPSYQLFLLGFSELYISERFIIPNLCPLKQDDRSSTLPSDPADILLSAFALRSDTTFHISGIVHIDNSSISYLVCA
ncbi:hypothetical protein RhiirA4_481524 [Rhizophagus irregularis]|uniref:Uncharacterized protein n=1 Tax=Rhizophagus irregularis TaxID=588596 RepID=A0A2I1HJL4_9GLOM|nr:hypothetical protein RhiirA4_481524 [Rhizophagus irregularis]